MSRNNAIERARATLADGRYEAVLRRRVAIRTVSQDAAHDADLRAYLESLEADLSTMGFLSRVEPNPRGAGPILVASRHESDALPTVLCYGHADVVTGMEGKWRDAGDPWLLRRDGDRLYGRGTADNKGQHTLLLLALDAAIGARHGHLGFNVRLVIDSCEEVGSRGLREFCESAREELRADFLIGSDGPRLSIDQPTFFLGTRGVYSFDLVCDLRESGHHSGNWGGLIANPAVLLSHAIAALVSQDGRIEVEGVVPREVPQPVRAALSTCRIEPGPGAPSIDADWGEPGLTSPERLFAWTALEVLAMGAGAPDKPVNAIPGKAVARCQIRYTVDTDPSQFLPAIQRRLTEIGLDRVQAVEAGARGYFPATRLDPSHPLVVWAANSVRMTLGVPPSIVPNAAGTLPNDCFADVLGLPTLWIPHSYPGCRQHAPDEHLLMNLVDEGLALMAGIFWDLGEPGATAWTGDVQAAEAAA